MSRIAAVLLAVIGGAATAIFALMLLAASLLGVLWLFVFGDDPWPGWAMTLLNLLIPLFGLFLWAVFGWQVWLRLRRYVRGGHPEEG